MKYLNRVLLILALSSFLIVSPVYALSSQGLEWGTPIGSRHDYALSVGGNFTLLSEMTPIHPTLLSPHDVEFLLRFYVMVTSHVPIDDEISEWSEIPMLKSSDYDGPANIDGYWVNGSTMKRSHFPQNAQEMCVPVGNWSLYTSITTWAEPFEKDDQWGVAGSYFPLKSSIDVSIKGIQNWTWSKTDGFLESWNLEYRNISSETRLSYIYLERESWTAPGLSMTNLSMIGVASSIVIIIVIAVVVRKR